MRHGDVAAVTHRSKAKAAGQAIAGPRPCLHGVLGGPVALNRATSGPSSSRGSRWPGGLRYADGAPELISRYRATSLKVPPLASSRYHDGHCGNHWLQGFTFTG